MQEFNKGVYDYIIATDEASGSAEHDLEDETHRTEDAKKLDVQQEECKIDRNFLTVALRWDFSHVNTERIR